MIHRGRPDLTEVSSCFLDNGSVLVSIRTPPKEAEGTAASLQPLSTSGESAKTRVTSNRDGWQDRFSVGVLGCLGRNGNVFGIGGFEPRNQ